MACGATMSLKRSLEFDPVHSRDDFGDHHHRLVKRRRCMPASAAPTKQHQMNPSPFLNAIPQMSKDELSAQLSAQIKRLHQRRHASSASSTNLSHSGSTTHSAASPRSSANDALAPRGSSSSSSVHSAAVVASMSTGSVDGGMTGKTTARRNQVPLFTLRQVGLVCERMMKEKEEKLQEEYDKVLTEKLSEQYDAFLKFNQDQMYRGFGESAASYVS